MAAIIPLAFSALDHVIKWIAALRKAGKQTGEWTAEHEAQFLERRNQITSQDHWKID
jgi:hypothetical protein